jgi:hypothetical protein
LAQQPNKQKDAKKDDQADDNGLFSNSGLGIVLPVRAHQGAAKATKHNSKLQVCPEGGKRKMGYLRVGRVGAAHIIFGRV